MSDKCPKCGGLKVVEGGQPCECYLSQRVATYLRPLGSRSRIPLDGPEAKQLNTVDINRPLFLLHPRISLCDLKGIMAYLLLRGGISRSFIVYNATDLMDIYLGKNPNVSSLNAINEDILLLTYGHAEYRNKSMDEVVSGVLTRRDFKGQPNWVFVQDGSDTEQIPYSKTIISSYPSVRMNWGGSTPSSPYLSSSAASVLGRRTIFGPTLIPEGKKGSTSHAVEALFETGRRRTK